MVFLGVAKVDAVALMEAAKSTMDAVGTHRLGLAEQGATGSRALISTYGDLRRLKDYLHRCIGAYRGDFEIELAPEDLPLLAASCRRAAEHTDLRLRSCRQERERNLLATKRDLYVKWALELVAEPQLHLPLPSDNHPVSPMIREFRSQMSRKLLRSTIDGSSLAGAAHGVDGVRMLIDDSGSPFAGSPGQGKQPAVSHGEPGSPLPVPRESGASGVGTARREEAPDPEVADPEVVAESGYSLGLDANRLRTPQLRAIMALDLRAYERAVAARDLRMAAVMLASVLEGAVIDYAMNCQLELGLLGSPESWNPQEVLLRIFGDQCPPGDRAAVYHVFNVRLLLRPSIQLMTPIVMTEHSFKKHVEFVGRALRRMGFTP